MYGITGGIPLYINKLGVQDGIKEALLENLFDASSYLFEEPQNLLKQELREPAVYNTIITTIASGASKLNEIATKAGLENAVCSKYTKVLLELGIIKKETPMTEKPGKKTIYRLADHFFGFWYRYVPHNMGAIVSERMGSIFDQVVAGSLSDYMGTVFEDMCKCYMLRYAQNLHVPITDIGQWWGTDPSLHKEVQIDIVAGTTDKGTYYIGSCKYKKEPIGVDELKLLEHYAGVLEREKLIFTIYFPKEDLKTLRHTGSYLQGHPDIQHMPGLDMSSGSLGQGISAAVGMALSAKLTNDDYRVYTLLGDGEIQEGQVWEASMLAGHRKLDNLVVIVDNNNLQIDGKITDVNSPYPIDKKFEAFNFHVINIDGNDFDQIEAAFKEARKTKGMPTAIIAKTIKGKGVSFMEDQAGWHGKAPNDEQYAQAMEELEKAGEALCQK